MTVRELSPKERIVRILNNMPNIADIRTRVIADIDVREPQNLQSSQNVGVIADTRTIPPLRGDALSAIPQRAEMCAALRAAPGRFSLALIEERRPRFGRIS
jgi:hypothetical protein